MNLKSGLTEACWNKKADLPPQKQIGPLIRTSEQQFLHGSGDCTRGLWVLKGQKNWDVRFHLHVGSPTVSKWHIPRLVCGSYNFPIWSSSAHLRLLGHKPFKGRSWTTTSSRWGIHHHAWLPGYPLSYYLQSWKHFLSAAFTSDFMVWFCSSK